MTVPHDTRDAWDPEDEGGYIDYVESDETYIEEDEPEDTKGDDNRWR